MPKLLSLMLLNPSAKFDRCERRSGEGINCLVDAGMGEDEDDGEGERASVAVVEDAVGKLDRGDEGKVVEGERVDDEEGGRTFERLKPCDVMDEDDVDDWVG